MFIILFVYASTEVCLFTFIDSMKPEATKEWKKNRLPESRMIWCYMASGPSSHREWLLDTYRMCVVQCDTVCTIPVWHNRICTWCCFVNRLCVISTESASFFRCCYCCSIQVGRFVILRTRGEMTSTRWIDRNDDLWYTQPIVQSTNEMPHKQCTVCTQYSTANGLTSFEWTKNHIKRYK